MFEKAYSPACKTTGHGIASGRFLYSPLLMSSLVLTGFFGLWPGKVNPMLKTFGVEQV